MVTDGKQSLISHLVAYARQQNRRLVRARQSGFRFPLAEYERTRAMSEARAIKGVPSRQHGAQLRQTLCEIADLVCEIDQQKNNLPPVYRGGFTQVVEATHGYVKTIAHDHGVVVYADQEPKKGMLS